jgi:hypothetical protein
VHLGHRCDEVEQLLPRPPGRSDEHASLPTRTEDVEGVALVEQRMGSATLPVQPRRLDRLDHVFIDHDLKAAALWANMLAELRQRRGYRWLWLGERELRARRMRVGSAQGNYWLPFLPDAYFEVVYPNGDVRVCLVEIDMGTLTLRRFGRKVQAFEAALDDGVFRRQFPNRDEFEVLVLTSSRRRLQSLRQVAARVVRGGRHTCGASHLRGTRADDVRQRGVGRPGRQDRVRRAVCRRGLLEP